MSTVDTTTITDPRFGEQTDALLSLLGGPQRLDYPSVLAGRDEEQDPAFAGTPDPGVRIAELYLPLRSGPGRARIYSGRQREPVPLLLWLHGGSFVAGSGRDLDTPCALIALRANATVISLDYRLAPEHPFPAALQDSYDALCWLAEHGAVLGGDGRVLIGGQSAGGNLAAGACLLARDRGGPPIGAQVLCYPLLDFGQRTESRELFNGTFLVLDEGDWAHHAYLGGQSVPAHAAPLRAKSLADLPPALVLGAGRDPLRDDARSYAARLAADGVPVRHVEYADTMHAFLNFSGPLSAAATHAAELIGDHLRGMGRPTAEAQRTNRSELRP